MTALRNGLIFSSTSLSAVSSACSLKAGITMKDIEVETVGLLHAGLVLQIVIVGLSWRIARRTGYLTAVPWILLALVVLHPGLSVSAFKEFWIYRGDCGGGAIEIAFALLLLGLLAITTYADLGRRRHNTSMSETV